MKHAKDYLDEANREVTRISAADAIPKHGTTGVQFIDVRDSGAIEKSGTIAGALRIPRGMIEFAADDDSPMRDPTLDRNAERYLVCGAGGQAALAGLTLKEMGYASVTNIGGVGDWKEAGGPMES